jgi:hypothetical protein
MSDRSDALTCSGACRVRAHRNGRLQQIRDIAARQNITAALILRAGAVKILRPDLADRVRDGGLDLDDVRGDIHAAFMEVLQRAIEAVS